MKVPQTFTLGRNLDEKIEEFRKIKIKYNQKSLNLLLESCEEFIEQKKGKTLEESYKIGLILAVKMKYTKHDLEEFSKRLTFPNRPCDTVLYSFSGVYLSALINNIITFDDEIVLRPKVELTGLGAFQDRGRVVVRYDTSNFTGTHMNGGMLIVTGSTGNWTGREMSRGYIEISGDAGQYLGYRMKLDAKIMVKGDVKSNPPTDNRSLFDILGGEIWVEGDIKGKIENCKARVYNKYKLIWPK